MNKYNTNSIKNNQKQIKIQKIFIFNMIFSYIIIVMFNNKFYNIVKIYTNIDIQLNKKNMTKIL